MVQINFAQKQINAKVVYYGPGMSGKTTNLEVVHQRAPDQNRGDLTSISTDGDRTLFFDFMPLDLGTVAGMRTSFQIYTVPGQVYYNSTRKLVLQGVDGVVFVADSGANMVEENLESLRNLEENLNEYGKTLAELPHVIQFNKRDLPNALPVEELNAQLNQYNAPTYEAVANTGQGVFPTLKALAASVLESIHQSSSGGGGGAPRPQAAGMPPPPSPTPAPPTSEAPAAPQQDPQSPGLQMAPEPKAAPAFPEPVAAPPAPAPAAPMQPSPSMPAAAQEPGIPMSGNTPTPSQTGFQHKVYAPADPPGQSYNKNVSNTGFNEVYENTTPAQSATIIDGGLQMAPRSGALGATKFQGAPPASSLMQTRPTEAPPPAPSRPTAKPSRPPGPLEGTRFKPRASARPTARPTPVKKSGKSLFTGLFVAIALVVGAVLVGVILSFF